MNVPESLYDFNDAQLHTHVKCAMSILKAFLRICFDLLEQNVSVNGKSLIAQYLQRLLYQASLLLVQLYGNL